ncbi:MAG TPA: FmdB family zinc ribbon protein [Propionicimonas sp.]|jgi:putative FmdB family regulatory protein|uniref:FmdB family zinc ribbon protein n=1 Tax=Propionicimonas sp. TaxID=1955623 RepID=UPI002F408EA3
MPTYQYRCTSCDRELEVVQKFTDDALTDCPECDGNLRKVFNAVGVVFKGSGFYATDNRTKGKAGAAKSGEKSEKSAEKAERSGEKSGKSESKPAAESKPKSEAKPSASTGASSAA